MNRSFLKDLDQFFSFCRSEKFVVRLAVQPVNLGFSAGDGHVYEERDVVLIRM